MLRLAPLHRPGVESRNAGAPAAAEVFLSARQRRRRDSLILSSMGKRGVGPLRRAGTRAKVGTEDVARSFGHVVHRATRHGPMGSGHMGSIPLLAALAGHRGAAPAVSSLGSRPTRRVTLSRVLASWPGTAARTI